MASSSNVSVTSFYTLVAPQVSYAPLSPLAVLPPLALFQIFAPLTINLEHRNYSFWQSQVLPVIRAHELEGYLLGTKPCPPQFVDHIIGGTDPSEVRQINPCYTF
ncbi:hypothetical protein TorRG33x02_195430 [Trema orientale]|uniref:Retrotransposon Copia-like N-terminal domain-containing protein n=1 Tax=Trema orientale TaxID=63057 RepID=A0A2P5EGP8_TREOI|nr:hypothetical protein TorRG33x02_195430 [Trema orientale]